MTGFEPIVTAAISGVALPIFQSMWEGGGRFLGLFGKRLDEQSRQLIFQASDQYAQNYRERHGIVKVLGMSEPIPLKEVYTTVQFLNENERKSLESVKDLETVFRQANKRSFYSKERAKRPGLGVANEKQFLMVLGGPGTGKSTFLRRIGLEVLQENQGDFEHRCIPVFIELKQFRSGSVDIKQTIAEEFRICGFPDYESFTGKALEQGKLLVLLDGLDEVATGQINEVIQQIQDFVDLYAQNRFITSCRVAAYRHNLRRFTDVAIAEFDDEQIQTFITNWFRSTPETAQDCWQKLSQSENTAAKELTQTPLLLTLICLLYQRARKFPAKRATLYEKALRVLLEEWAGEKGIPQEELYRGLDTRLKETLLSEIAYNSFIKDCLFLPRRDIAKQIQTFLEESLTDEPSIDGEAVLKSIEVQHGVLVERAEAVYSFSHLTLQEYLTAQYIDDHRKNDELVVQHLSDPRWKEVFLLVAGLMRGGADPLLLEMEQGINSSAYINTLRLNSLLEWASQTTVRARAIYIYIASASASAIVGVSELDRSINRASALELELDSNSNIDLVRASIRARDIFLTIDGTINRAKATAISIVIDRASALELELDSDSNIDSDGARAIVRAIIRASELVRAIDRAKVNAISNAIDNAISSASDIDSARAIARASVKAIARASVRAIDIDIDIINDIESDLTSASIVDYKALSKKIEDLRELISLGMATFDEWRNFANQLIQTFLTFFHLDRELVTLSPEEAKALEKYLYAVKLIIDCKKAAVRVSRKEWEAIESRLLTVPGGGE